MSPIWEYPTSDDTAVWVAFPPRATVSEVDGAGFEDFTEEAYGELLALAKDSYSFERYGTQTTLPHVLWRHDVDYSMHRAVRIARIEAEQGVHATYFFLLHSELYNLFELEVFRRAQEIVALGHSLGVHFDAAFYGGFDSEDALAIKLRHEADLFEQIFEHPVDVFSLHNTDVGRSARFDADQIGGLLNASGRGIRERYGYVSDSNGYWRFERLRDVLESGVHPRLHVLTHPEWWQREPMSPRARIIRCIEGRRHYSEQAYDLLLETYGRTNIR